MKGKKMVIDCEKCKNNNERRKVYPERIVFVKDGKVWIDYDKCDLDEMYVSVCFR